MYYISACTSHHHQFHPPSKGEDLDLQQTPSLIIEPPASWTWLRLTGLSTFGASLLAHLLSWELPFTSFQPVSEQTANPALLVIRSPAAQIVMYQQPHQLEELIWPPSAYGGGCLLENRSVTQTGKIVPVHPHTREETTVTETTEQTQEAAPQQQLQEDCQVKRTQTGVVLATNSKASWAKSKVMLIMQVLWSN